MEKIVTANQPVHFETRKTIRCLALLCIIGSVITFYATNLVLSDVSNMFYMTVTRDVISSLPILFASLDFVLATIAVIRLYARPQFAKRQALLYTRILTAFSLIGIVTSLLTGAWIYGSFTAPYPFPGAILLSLVWHAAMLVLALRQNRKCKGWQDDEKKRKMEFTYILFTVALSVLIFFSYNRFGAFLLMPIYVHVPTLHLTWSFYLSLLLPIALLGQMMIYFFGLDRDKPQISITYIVIVLIVNCVLAYLVIGIGMKNTQFISAVSPAVAIERLLTQPIDTIVHFSLVMILGLYNLYFPIHRIRKAKRREAAQQSVK